MKKTRERTAFGQRLFDARGSMGQQAVAEAVGISQSTLAGLEKSAASSKHTVQLANLYGVNPTWLATGEGPKDPTAPAIVQPSGTAFEVPQLVRDLMVLPQEDRQRFLEEIRSQAAKWRAYAKERGFNVDQQPPAPPQADESRADIHTLAYQPRPPAMEDRRLFGRRREPAQAESLRKGK